MIDFKDLRPGMVIRISFGSRGTQNAVVNKVTREGSVYVCKWRKSSQRWTQPVRLYPSEYVGFVAHNTAGAPFRIE